MTRIGRFVAGFGVTELGLVAAALSTWSVDGRFVRARRS
jgi:hypothetical protein